MYVFYPQNNKEAARKEGKKKGRGKEKEDEKENVGWGRITS